MKNVEFKDVSFYPKNLVERRELIEGSFVFSLWKNVESYSEYEKDINASLDLLTADGKFYYSLGLKMYKKGYRSFDDASIHTYLSDNEVLMNGFVSRGGFQPVHEMTSILSISNTEGYYDELIKSNAILQLYDEGYDIEKYATEFDKMNYEELEDFMEFKLNEVFLKSTSSGITYADLTSGYDSWIDKWDSGEGVGFRVGFPLLNYHLAGVHRKNLILHLGGIGQGKSTSSLLFYILPILESGEKIAIVANEQDEEQFRQMILATVLFNRINYKKMNRQKLLFGGFTDDDKIHLKQSAQWLEKYKNQLHYVHLTDYGTSNVKRVIKKYSKLGVGAFLFDTMKPSDEASDKAWAEFSETAKMLFLLAQKENVAIIATAQLSSESAKRKYLDLSCIGKSRAIAETAGQVIMFRPMRDQEKEKLEVYKFNKDLKGKNTTSKIIIQLDKNKDYIIVFIPKNRYGKADIQIVYERNQDFNYLNEIGYCHVEYDGFGNAK